MHAAQHHDKRNAKVTRHLTFSRINSLACARGTSTREGGFSLFAAAIRSQFRHPTSRREALVTKMNAKNMRKKGQATGR
jgi:hypothetical protein